MIEKMPIEVEISFKIDGLLFSKDGENAIIALDKKQFQDIQKKMAEGLSLTKSSKDCALYSVK